MNLFTQGFVNMRIYCKSSKIVQQLQTLKWLLDEIFVLDPEVPDDDYLGENTETIDFPVPTYQRVRYQPAEDQSP